MGIIVGCDISKDWFDVALVENEGAPRRTRVKNKARAIERFAQELPAGSFVGMEATGQMHELLARCLVKRGHTVFVINPRWIRLYAKGVGLRGKTDRTDALLIARYVSSEHSRLRAYQPPGPEQDELRKLLLRRRTVTKLRAATRQSLGSEARALMQQFNRVLKTIDGRIGEIIRSVPAWRELARLLRSEPGVGPVVAAHLVQVLTRFPFERVDAFIAHTGLDPRPNDSGQKRGRRWLTHHGDSALRTMLFLAAMAASKRGEWHTLYLANKQKGLSSTAALIALARKLARIAYSLFRSGESYDPSRVGSPKPA